MTEAMQNILGLFGANKEKIINQETIYYLKSNLVLLIISIIGATPFMKTFIEKLKSNNKMNRIVNLFEPVVLICLLLIVTAYLVDNSYNPFLYFRF